MKTSHSHQLNITLQYLLRYVTTESIHRKESITNNFRTNMRTLKWNNKLTDNLGRHDTTLDALL